MTYRQWKSRYGSMILREGAKFAALVACVPDSYAQRYNRDAKRRDALARRRGGSNRFTLPLRRAN
jgi:hypothetical protein